MTPQHIVEHLGFSLQISTGKSPQRLHMPEDVAATIKQKVIYTEAELPEGVKNPLLGDEPPVLKFADLPSAIDQLMMELDYFEEFYRENPDAKNMHMRMGELDKNEWNVFHGKHFKHHFKQFNLV
jgi:oxepin-CoA hydrolase/3-oxo-5,6-dehydrosuberyl-CoA semialdehyde dehydrogenase